MTWTYTASPSTSNRDAVRILVGDIDTNNQLVSDEIIDWMLSTNSTNEMAAADVAEHLAAKFSVQVNTSNMSLSISAGQRAAAYYALAKNLRYQRNDKALQNATILAGGISKDERNDLDEDTTVIQPGFKIGMHDWRPPANADDDTTE